MKNTIVLFCALLFGTASIKAQVAKEKWDLPSAIVKSLDGKSIDSKTFENDGKPIIISFWATWCKPCVLELNTISDYYADWQEETGVKLIAISIDDARNTAKVAPFVNGKDWDYEVYMDPNGDFKRVMNVNTVPHTFVLNGDKQVVWSHNAYAPGDEEHLYEIVKENSGK
ncbi:MAG: TlpA family protein disulfide reductase [Flavobacteriales bacterium]|nr:TlpA family protein disulfide reductase [Flavobacteriales bacterium]